ncbi:MAG TPA: hypothetical protein VGC10_08820 [Sphingomonas sp.]
MNGRVADAAPLRFLAAVVGAWAVARGAVLLGWQPPDRPAALRPAPGAPAAASAATPAMPAGEGPHRRPVPSFAAWRAAAHAAPAAPWNSSPERLIFGDNPGFGGAQLLLLAAFAGSRGPIYRHATGIAEATTTADIAKAVSRWSGSAWAFVRGGGRATPLAPGGQIGGGQAGARILYRLDDRGAVSASGRLSRTIGGVAQSEAAAGIDIRPIASLPVHLLAERRIALDKGGRDAWTLGAAGGIYAAPLGGGWRLDAYGEAGVVGMRRRDLYADGAARIARAIDLGGGRSLAPGGGVWAAAQPGASRIDIGPSLVLRLPVEKRTVALALDWRMQMTGQARPHSGLAFTTAVDF